jgi:hypothetical protein
LSFTVHLGIISASQVKAYWFNPRAGAVSYITTYTNSGTQNVNPGGSAARE